MKDFIDMMQYFEGFPYGPFTFTEDELRAQATRVYHTLRTRFFAYPLADVCKVIESDSICEALLTKKSGYIKLDTIIEEYFVQWIMKTMQSNSIPISDLAFFFVLDEFELAVTNIQDAET